MTLLGVLYFLGSKNTGFWLLLKWCFCIDSIFKSSLGPGSAAEEKGKNRVQIGKISAREASQAVSPPIFFFAHFFFPQRQFFLLFPTMRSLVPGYFKFRMKPNFSFLLKLKMVYSSAITHKLYVILLRRSMTFYWRHHHFEILQICTTCITAGVWICVYVRGLN